MCAISFGLMQLFYLHEQWETVPSPDVCFKFSFFSDFSAGNTIMFGVSRVKSMYGGFFSVFFLSFFSPLFPTATPSAFHLSTETFFAFTLQSSSPSGLS